MSITAHPVYLLGAGYTPLRRWPKRDHIDLAREALTTTLADAGLDDGQRIERIWFGNCGMHFWGQSNIRGQAVCTPLAEEGLLPHSPEVINVEGGCATGSLAAYGAIGDILAGRSHITLALGVEKTFIAHQPAHIFELFASGMNQWRKDEDLSFYQSEAARMDLPFSPSPDRIMLLDIAALHARAYMEKYSVTAQDLALIAEKSHANGALNPRAQYQTHMTVDDILNDHEVLTPFTRSMCAPVSDGAAAAIFVSQSELLKLPAEVRERAIPVLACELAGGQRTTWEEVGPTQRAAQRAYRTANCHPRDIDVIELHDATSFAELLHLEELGLCEPGDGVRLTRSGATRLDGRQPVNPSGGLISKGHPLAASGLAMLSEVATQLRSDAKQRQIKANGSPPKLGLTHNGGGMLGFQEASVVVTLLGHIS